MRDIFCPLRGLTEHKCRHTCMHESEPMILVFGGGGGGGPTASSLLSVQGILTPVELQAEIHNLKLL
jgi:hypothetical protein